MSQRRFFHDYVLHAGRNRPRQLAISAGAEQWTFARLEATVTQLSSQLAELGVGCGQRVVLLLNSSAMAIALELATCRAGAAFVPLSPELPAARVASIIASVMPRLIVVDQLADTNSWGESDCAVARIAGDGIELTRRSCEVAAKLPRKLLETDPAYLIFTSGSTGEPKGIVMSHGAAVSALLGAAEMPLGTEGPLASTAPLQFDFSILDIGLSIALGRTLVLVPRFVCLEPERLANYLLQAGVTQLDGVPSLLRGLIREEVSLTRLRPALRTIVYGGEGFSPSEVEALQRGLDHTRVIQAFGHSESLLCSFGELDRPANCLRGRVSIGKAFGAMEMFLFDGEREITEPGACAELWIRGPSLFSGYWADERSTERKLRRDPRYPACNDRAFCSGDLVFRDDQGDFFFWGRQDTQIKLAGNRLELEEVEAVLQSDHAVLKAVVAVTELGGRPSLVAFVVPKLALNERDLAAIRERSSLKLPHYAVPRRLLAIDSIPLTFNGKADRQRLLDAAPREGHDTWSAAPTTKRAEP